jgi:hypothetical protein
MRHATVPPSAKKPDEHTTEIHMDGRLVGTMVERRIAQRHRFAHGSADHDGRMGLPLADYSRTG